MVSCSRPEPLSRASLPLEVIEEVIDLAFQSKKDLFAFSLVAKGWVFRSRYWIFNHYLQDLLLESWDEILTFSVLVSSAYCTFQGQSFMYLKLQADLPPTKLHEVDSLQCEYLLAFLRHANVKGGLSINLCPRTHAYYSPLWSRAQSWNELSELEITSTVPSLYAVTSLILSLPRLTGLSIDAEYSSDRPAIPHPDDILPCAIENLYLGPRGYSLLSWLARFKRPYPIETVYLNVGEESITPLQEYAKSAGDGIEYLTVGFYGGYGGLQEFASCMPFFTSLLELEFQVGSKSVPTLQEFITTAIPLIISPSLMTFSMFVPPLPGSFEDEKRLHRLVRQYLRETPINVDEPEQDNYCSSTVCQRSWMGRVL